MSFSIEIVCGRIKNSGSSLLKNSKCYRSWGKQANEQQNLYSVLFLLKLCESQGDYIRSHLIQDVFDDSLEISSTAQHRRKINRETFDSWMLHDILLR